ncbi:hypothetical protein RJ640_022076 [Escallonia rubra]|uniref:Uncharacterized protein n=1 Tax=Escallonia rubra TaxID=112253 RepID=A0AA88QQE8_9ASTE|nr:hypothetical protein RJ640_022076 [Escallonia rubra]
MEGGKPVIITNAEGQRTTPSVVAWTKNRDRLIRDETRKNATGSKMVVVENPREAFEFCGFGNVGVIPPLPEIGVVPHGGGGAFKIGVVVGVPVPVPAPVPPSVPPAVLQN